MAIRGIERAEGLWALVPGTLAGGENPSKGPERKGEIGLTINEILDNLSCLKRLHIIPLRKWPDRHISGVMGGGTG